MRGGAFKLQIKKTKQKNMKTNERQTANIVLHRCFNYDYFMKSKTNARAERFDLKKFFLSFINMRRFNCQTSRYIRSRCAFVMWKKIRFVEHLKRH